MNRFLFPAAVVACLMTLNGISPAAEPPKPKKVPRALEKHGIVRVDDYYWLKDRKSPEVIAHLNAENAYAQAALGHTEKLQAKLFS